MSHRSASCGWIQGKISPSELHRHSAHPLLFFSARTRRRLRSSPRQMIPRISLEFPDFGMGLPPRRWRRCGLQGLPPTESVPCLAWRSANAAARGRIPDQGSWALEQDLPQTSRMPRFSAAAGPPPRVAGHAAHRTHAIAGSALFYFKLVFMR